MTAQISVKRGDTISKTFTWNDADGNPVDLSGCSARLQLRNGLDSLVGEFASPDGGLEVEPDGATGTVYWRVEAEETAGLEPSSYSTDMELTFPDGTVKSTETFFVVIEKDETR